MVAPNLFLAILKPSQGKHINKLLARNAPAAPGGDAFHIHQVVDTFQMNMVTYVSQKNFFLLSTLVSNQSNGVHAINISNVSGDTGHAAKSKKPEVMARKRFVNRFKKMIYCKNRRCLAA